MIEYLERRQPCSARRGMLCSERQARRGMLDEFITTTKKKQATMPTTSNETTDRPSRQAKSRTSRGTWHDFHRMLKIYQSKKGHCNVPSTYAANPTLANYVRNTRLIFRQEQEGIRVNKCITDEERTALDAMGFEWEKTNNTGRRTYRQNKALLTQFKIKHGHCNVPQLYPNDQELADWCSEIRKMEVGKGKGMMGKERYNKLQEIGFFVADVNIVSVRTATDTDEDEADGSTNNANRHLFHQKENSNPNDVNISVGTAVDTDEDEAAGSTNNANHHLLPQKENSNVNEMSTKASTGPPSSSAMASKKSYSSSRTNGKKCLKKKCSERRSHTSSLTPGKTTSDREGSSVSTKSSQPTTPTSGAIRRSARTRKATTRGMSS